MGKTTTVLLLIAVIILCLFAFTGCDLFWSGGLKILSPDEGDLITSDEVNVRVGCDDEEIVRVDCRSQTEDVSCTEGEKDYCNFTVDLSQGSNTITVRGYDTNGQEVDSDSVTVTCDSIPPELTVLSPSDGATINALSVTISGIVTDGNGVKNLKYKGDFGLFGYLSWSSGGEWSLTLSNLKNNTNYLIQFIATDLGGWTSTETTGFRIQYVEP